MRLVYTDVCPECGGSIIRQGFSRYSMCRDQCGILLNIPSWREPGQKVSAVCWQVGDGERQKMTWEHYEMLSAMIKINLAKFPPSVRSFINPYQIKHDINTMLPRL